MTTATQRRSSIDADGITALVDTFYAKVRGDPQLGPVFEGAIRDWEPHLETMRRFWSSVMLRTATYHGTPMQKHEALEGLSPELFARWLTLFDATAAELFEPPLAAEFSERAHRIAQSLQLGIFYRPRRAGGT